MFGSPLNNLCADVDMNTFWNACELDKAKTEDVVKNPTHAAIYKAATGSTQAVYDQEIEFVTYKHNNADVYISNTMNLDASHYTFVPTGDGTFTFKASTAPSQDVTFKVMVAVSYKNDNNGVDVIKVPVNIKIDVE